MAGSIDVITNTDKKYMSMTMGRFQFMDSLQHLNASLEKLAKRARRKPALARKGVYPYEYMNSFERFDETDLPPARKFTLSLNNFEPI